VEAPYGQLLTAQQSVRVAVRVCLTHHQLLKVLPVELQVFEAPDCLGLLCNASCGPAVEAPHGQRLFAQQSVRAAVRVWVRALWMLWQCSKGGIQRYSGCPYVVTFETEWAGFTTGRKLLVAQAAVSPTTACTTC
jgi:hypothetical protein